MIMFNRERSSRDRQRGVALLMALIALLIIGAITAGAILLSNTETSVSSNFRDEQLAFFSAKAGIEEARDRMQAGVTNTLRTASLPTTLPGTTGSVLYILNPANGETVAPWNGSSCTTYPDDEIETFLRWSKVPRHRTSACRATAAIVSRFQTFPARSWCCSSIPKPIRPAAPGRPSTSRDWREISRRTERRCWAFQRIRRRPRNRSATSTNFRFL